MNTKHIALTLITIAVAPLMVTASEPDCGPYLKAFGTFTKAVDTRATLITKNLLKVESRLRLEELRAELLGAIHQFNERKATLARLGLITSDTYLPDDAYTARDTIATIDKTLANLKGDEFVPSLTRALLIVSNPGLKSREAETIALAEGALSKARVSMDDLKIIGRLAESLSTHAWIPETTRAQLALMMWRKKQEPPEDIFTLLPQIYAWLPPGYTRQTILNKYLRPIIGSQYASPILAAPLANKRNLSSTEVDSLVALYRAFSRRTDSAPAALAAVAALRYGVTYDEYMEIYARLDKHISYRRSKQMIGFVNTYLGLRKSTGDDDRLIDYYKRASSSIGDSAAARKVALACLKHSVSPDTALKLFALIRERTGLYNKYVPILLDAAIGQVDAQSAALKAAEYYLAVRRVFTILQSNQMASIAATATKMNTPLDQLDTIHAHYQSLAGTPHVYNRANAVAMLRGLMTLGLTASAVNSVKDEYVRLRQQDVPYDIAAKWAVAFVTAQLNKTK